MYIIYLFIDINLITFSRALLKKLESMGWLWQNFPRDPKEYQSRVVPLDSAEKPQLALLQDDLLSPASSGFAFSGKQPDSFDWNVDTNNALASFSVYIPTKKSVHFSLVFAMNNQSVTESLKEWTDNFDAHYNQVRRWKFKAIEK